MWSVGKDVVKMWNNWNPHTLLVGMQNDTSTLKNKGFFNLKLNYSYHLTQQSHS